jgi:hypothetical protein
VVEPIARTDFEPVVPVGGARGTLEAGTADADTHGSKGYVPLRRRRRQEERGSDSGSASSRDADRAEQPEGLPGQASATEPDLEQTVDELNGLLGPGSRFEFRTAGETQRDAIQVIDRRGGGVVVRSFGFDEVEAVRTGLRRGSLFVDSTS